MGDQINKLLRTQHQLTQKLGRDPSIEELAEALDVPPKKVENMIKVSRRPLSLETPTDNEEDSVLGDFIQDNEIPAPDETATYNLLKRASRNGDGFAAPTRGTHLAASIWAVGRPGLYPGRSRQEDGCHPRARPPDRSSGAQPAASPDHSQKIARLFRRIIRKGK